MIRLALAIALIATPVMAADRPLTNGGDDAKPKYDQWIERDPCRGVDCPPWSDDMPNTIPDLRYQEMYRNGIVICPAGTIYVTIVGSGQYACAKELRAPE